jgi:putative OPT family oligopeptide transporter
MTVSASIPAAILSMAVLRGILKRGTILENNIVQTMAASGESVAAGIIFTIPALVIAGLWQDFDFWTVTLIGLLGGTLGVLFMIPLRRTLVVEDKELVYPEGLACAKVLEAGQSGGSDLKAIFLSLGGGALFKSAIGLVGVLRPTLESAIQVGRTVVPFASDISVALLAIGVIVGLEVGAQVLAGGVIGWLIGIPLYYLNAPLPVGAAPIDAAWSAWSEQIRYVGVGTMVVGGVTSLWSMRAGIAKGVRQAMSGRGGATGPVERTDEDLSQTTMVSILAACAAATVGLYWMLTDDFAIALTSGVAMVIASFFFAAVSSYIVGLVGSSNNPISGMTICALLFSAGVLLLLGMTGSKGVLAALGVAGVVCCAAATAGDTSQDLKTGFLVGATPWRQQAAQLIGISLPTMLIAPVLTLLHHAYGIGTGGEQALRAPQATLFASIAQALFGQGEMPWDMVLIGAGIAVALLVLDGFLVRAGVPFRAHVMPVAVGIYLPMGLSVPIFIGGCLHHRLARRGEAATNRGMLIGSGLIAGEALAGILIAALIYATGRQYPIPLLDSGALTFAVSAAVVWLVYRSASRKP